MKGYREKRVVSPPILNSRWKCMVSFRPWQSHPPIIQLKYWDWTLWENNLLSLTEITGVHPCNANSCDSESNTKVSSVPSVSALSIQNSYFIFFLCYVDRASRYNCVKKNQLNAELSIFLQPVHVSGVSRPIIRRYDRMYTTFGTYSFWRDNVFGIDEIGGHTGKTWRHKKSCQFTYPRWPPSRW
jgi:hypothetical protein